MKIKTPDDHIEDYNDWFNDKLMPVLAERYPDLLTEKWIPQVEVLMVLLDMWNQMSMES